MGVPRFSVKHYISVILADVLCQQFGDGRGDVDATGRHLGGFVMRRSRGAGAVHNHAMHNPRLLLVLSCLLMAAIWQLPYGHWVLYPFTLLATFAHEMGHGLTAMLVGATFDQLQLYPNGSGVAVWHGNPGRLARAAIAAGGLLGPSLAGVGLLLLTRSTHLARIVLGAFALVVVVLTLIWVRNGFGFLFLLSMAAMLGLVARVLPGAAALTLYLIATTLCLSWFSDLDYMFAAQAHVNGTVHPSDSATIADALWLPYWFWGGVIATLSLVLTTIGIVIASS